MGVPGAECAYSIGGSTRGGVTGSALYERLGTTARGCRASQASATERAAASSLKETDKDPRGAPYAAGELIVRYEEGAPAQAPDEVPQESGGRVSEEIPELDIQVIAFPEIKEEGSGETREQKLEQKKEELQKDPAVEAVDYNYLRKPAYTPNDSYFGYLWGFKKIQAPATWDRTRGDGVKVAMVDSGIDYFHPEFSGKIYRERDWRSPTSP